MFKESLILPSASESIFDAVIYYIVGTIVGASVSALVVV